MDIRRSERFSSSDGTSPRSVNRIRAEDFGGGLFFFFPFNSTVAPRGTNVQTPGALIYTQSGTLVWASSSFPLTFSSSYINPTNSIAGDDLTGYTQTLAYQVQMYKGEKVLTVWQGQLNLNGYGVGWDLILDQTYSVSEGENHNHDRFMMMMIYLS